MEWVSIITLLLRRAGVQGWENVSLCVVRGHPTVSKWGTSPAPSSIIQADMSSLMQYFYASNHCLRFKIHTTNLKLCQLKSSDCQRYPAGFCCVSALNSHKSAASPVIFTPHRIICMSEVLVGLLCLIGHGWLSLLIETLQFIFCFFQTNLVWADLCLIKVTEI